VRGVIFAGPSLPRAEIEAVQGLSWRPPVCHGDLYREALSRPALIGVVDGYFEAIPTVWHKEILWAMTQGIHVYGSSSIGALRAAELADFGMKGYGRIYEAYRDGTLQDDDEVAVQHGPEEVGFVTVTEAMVNVRATLERAENIGIIKPPIMAALSDIAKLLFYKDRTYDAIIHRAREEGLPQEALKAVEAWLPIGRVNQKKLDAQTMLSAISRHLAIGLPKLQVAYRFAHTSAWEAVCRNVKG